MFVFVWFFVPETKGTYLGPSVPCSTPRLTRRLGMSLEAMDELFGITNTDHKPSLVSETVRSDKTNPVAEVEQMR